MEDASHAQMVSLIWNIADDVLRDVFLRGQYRDVILPMIVLRRLDALLEPTKAEVDAEVKENGIDADVLFDITKLPYYNTSKWTLNILKAQATDDEKILLDNFNEYLLGFSENVRDVLRKFGFISKDGKSAAEKAQKLSDNHRLLAVILLWRLALLLLALPDRRDHTGIAGVITCRKQRKGQQRRQQQSRQFLGSCFHLYPSFLSLPFRGSRLFLQGLPQGALPLH